MINNIEGMEYVKTFLMAKSPYYRILLSYFEIEYNNKISTACVDASGLIEINEDFWKILDTRERVTIILHEMMHVLFKHHERSKTLNYDSVQVVGDLLINETLLDIGLFYIKKEGYICVENFNERFGTSLTRKEVVSSSLESIINRVPELREVSVKGIELSNDINIQPSSRKPINVDKILSEVGNIIRIGADLSTINPYKRVLSALCSLVSSKYKRKYKWENRRIPPQSVIIKGRKKSDKLALLIIIDVSASMDYDSVEKAFEVLRSFSRIRFHFATHTTDVQYYGTRMPKQITTDGGTNYDTVLKFIDEGDFDSVIWITDGTVRFNQNLVETVAKKTKLNIVMVKEPMHMPSSERVKVINIADDNNR